MSEKKQNARVISYITIPFVLAVPPFLGWFIGSWLDKKLDTDPYLMMLLIGVGFVSGFFEFYKMIKRYGFDDEK